MSDNSYTNSTSSSKHSTPVIIKPKAADFDDIIFSPPDNTDFSGGIVVSSLLRHRTHGSANELSSPFSSDVPTQSKGSMDANTPVNKLLNIESYPPTSIRKNYSMSTVPEFSDLVTQARDRGIGPGDTLNPPAFLVADADPEKLLLHTGGPIPRAASVGNLPVHEKKTHPSPEIAKFKLDNASPNVTHRDLNQFAPLNF